MRNSFWKPSGIESENQSWIESVTESWIESGTQYEIMWLQEAELQSQIECETE